MFRVFYLFLSKVRLVSCSIIKSPEHNPNLVLADSLHIYILAGKVTTNKNIPAILNIRFSIDKERTRLVLPAE